VKVTVKDKVALVEMNPPSRLIFLTTPLIQELNEVLLALEKDPEVSVVVLTGKGNSFATGADIKQISEQTLKS
jgi:enoyl-CoA hydratase/carnithine racemase